MREHLSEPITLDDLANVAMFSKFHFSRLFQSTTGVPPGKFLSALRLEKAKELLLTTRWNVVDIGTAVGYNSVGTFSTRFRKSVGLSPSDYRSCRGFAPWTPSPEPLVHSSRPRCITGRISLPPGDGRHAVFVGVFPGPIPEGRPLASTVVDAPGPYELVLGDVDRGHVAAFSFQFGPTPGGHPLSDADFRRVASCRLDGIGADPATVNLRLAPVGALDLPILVAAPLEDH